MIASLELIGETEWFKVYLKSKISKIYVTKLEKCIQMVQLTFSQDIPKLRYKLLKLIHSIWNGIDCAIICDVILVLLRLQSLFFFVVSKATAPCAKMWSLSHCYRVTWRFKPSPYNVLCKGMVNVWRSYKHINFKGKQKQVMWVVQEGH